MSGRPKVAAVVVDTASVDSPKDCSTIILALNEANGSADGAAPMTGPHKLVPLFVGLASGLPAEP
jgi:hypothetical protein